MSNVILFNLFSQQFYMDTIIYLHLRSLLLKRFVANACVTQPVAVSWAQLSPGNNRLAIKFF